MKYLKYFKEDSEYTQFKNSSDYVTPNVSYIEAIKAVNFNSAVLSIIELYAENTYPEVEQNIYNIFTKYIERLGLNVSTVKNNLANGMMSVEIALHPEEQSLYFVCMSTEEVLLEKLDADDATYVNRLSLNFGGFKGVCDNIQFWCEYNYTSNKSEMSYSLKSVKTIDEVGVDFSLIMEGFNSSNIGYIKAPVIPT